MLPEKLPCVIASLSPIDGDHVEESTLPWVHFSLKMVSLWWNCLLWQA